MYVSKFRYLGPKVMSILPPPSIISQKEKYERHLIWPETIVNTFKHKFTGNLDTLNLKIVTSDPFLGPLGHIRS